MEIDAFTVGAQVVNFLILVYLLRRFLYRPVLSAMDRREANIARRLTEAQEKAVQAEKEAESYRARSQALEDQRDQMVRDMHKEVEERREAMLESLRKDVAELGQRWRQQVERERQSFLATLRESLSREVCALAGQALKRLADVDVQRQLVTVFIRQLAALAPPDRQLIEKASVSGELELVSALTLEAPDQRRLTDALAGILGREPAIRFSLDPGLICGIEVRAPGYKLGWSMAERLAEAETAIAAQLATGPAGSSHAG